jgi:predicted metal-dependent hydrolase
MVARCREVRRSRSRPRRLPGPQGRAYNLEALFRTLNREYFGGRLGKPALSWSEGASRSVLGHYEFDENTIVVSGFLDSGRVPLDVVRYILFHEMLHMKHGTRIEGTREIVHPPEFRREERTFREYAEANRWLEAH